MRTQHLVRLPCTLLVAVALFQASWLATATGAQDRSVRPGINQNFEKPDLAQMLKTLEGENRAIYRYRYAIVAALSLREGMAVADVGAGTGFLTRLMAQEVGPKGRVYAVDIAQPILDHIRKTAETERLTNVVTVLGEQKTTNLAAGSLDLALLSDVYHHFEYPELSLASIHQALRPGGQLVVIDFERVKGVSPEFTINHLRAGKGTFTDEIKDAGFDLLKEIPLIEGQYFLVFKKRAW